jgi:hypothetical protein
MFCETDLRLFDRGFAEFRWCQGGEAATAAYLSLPPPPPCNNLWASLRASGAFVPAQIAGPEAEARGLRLQPHYVCAMKRHCRRWWALQFGAFCTRSNPASCLAPIQHLLDRLHKGGSRLRPR